MKKLLINLGYLIRKIGLKIQPSYWVCSNCGNLEFKERETICWACGIGEVIYKGKVFKRTRLVK